MPTVDHVANKTRCGDNTPLWHSKSRHCSRKRGWYSRTNWYKSPNCSNTVAFGYTPAWSISCRIHPSSKEQIDNRLHQTDSTHTVPNSDCFLVRTWHSYNRGVSRMWHYPVKCCWHTLPINKRHCHTTNRQSTWTLPEHDCKSNHHRGNPVDCPPRSRHVLLDSKQTETLSNILVVRNEDSDNRYPCHNERHRRDNPRRTVRVHKRQSHMHL